MIPLMVDCTNKSVAIFGGGKVGARKARYFVDEADVTVYSRTFSPAFESIPVKQIQTELSVTEEKITDFIRGAFLVITATSDPGLNQNIAARCKAVGILCNNATDPLADVTLPSKFNGEKFTIAISTRGGSPAVARFIREKMEAAWPNLDLMITLEEYLRQDLKDRQIPENQRRDILTAILHDPAVWERLPGGIESTFRLVQERYHL
jgi:precorrin-2 dehydrogenase / sirohydrochlorin ferrochelatase